MSSLFQAVEPFSGVRVLGVMYFSAKHRPPHVRTWDHVKNKKQTPFQYLNKRKKQQVWPSVTLYTCIREVLGSNLGQAIPPEGFKLFSSGPAM
jgi:hypothetical protein